MDYSPILSATAAVASALATIILVKLTSNYVRLTANMLKETQTSKYPNIYIDIEFDGISQVKFILGNSGSTPAHDIVLKVKENVPWLNLQGRNSGISSLPISQHGLKYLAPNRILKFTAGYIDNETDFFAKDNVIEVGLEYRADNGEKIENLYSIELYSYNGTLLESFKDPQRQVAEAIKETADRQRLEEHTRQQNQQFFKSRCPKCAEAINQGATKCPHCHEPIEPQKSGLIIST